jgi:hypothetical protein
LELSGVYAESWNSYIDILMKCDIFINEEEDELMWSTNPSGGYMPRIGYKTIAMEGFDQPLF